MKDKKIKRLFDDWMKSDDMSADEVAFVKQYTDDTDDTEFLAHGFYAGYCLADKHTKRAAGQKTMTDWQAPCETRMSPPPERRKKTTTGTACTVEGADVPRQPVV